MRCFATALASAKVIVMATPSSVREVIKTTCPRDCYDGCGIVVIRRDGRVTKVLGDPDHHVARGALCGKCAVAYNGVWLDAARRLTNPLVRTGPKGRRRLRRPAGTRCSR